MSVTLSTTIIAVAAIAAATVALCTHVCGVGDWLGVVGGFGGGVTGLHTVKAAVSPSGKAA